MSRTPVIETENLAIGYVRKRRQPVVVHRDLNLALYGGELTALLGLNGAGKSTLLRTLCGFQPSIGGEIRINGEPLSRIHDDRRARLIGVTLTEAINAGGVTVRELVSLGRHPYTGFLGRLRNADKRIVAESMEATGIVCKADNYVAELSDGERQKALIAKALAQQCPIILLDEPTAFLDVTARMETMSLLHRLAADKGKAILLSTHDLELAIQMCDRLWLQQKESPLIAGSPEDLILDGSFDRFFGQKGVGFDSATGKLTTARRLRPVAITGDELTVYWVINALARNGYRAAATDEQSDIRIDCESPHRLFIYSSAHVNPVCCHNVASLIANVVAE